MRQELEKGRRSDAFKDIKEGLILHKEKLSNKKTRGS
jgi:hypothetical protein